MFCLQNSNSRFRIPLNSISINNIAVVVVFVVLLLRVSCCCHLCFYCCTYYYYCYYFCSCRRRRRRHYNHFIIIILIITIYTQRLVQNRILSTESYCFIQKREYQVDILVFFTKQWAEFPTLERAA